MTHRRTVKTRPTPKRFHLAKVMRWWRRRRTTCCTMPLPRTAAQDGGGALYEAWETATGLSSTVSLMGTADAILKSENRAYADYFGVEVFPQLKVLDAVGAVEVARAYKPKWLNLLVEANDPKHGSVSNAFLDGVREWVRKVSPRTKCCISNQYEMAHNNDDRFKWVDWPGADADAVTSYPGLHVIGVGPGYYRDRPWRKPLIIAECGATDPALQLAMVKALLRLGPKVLNYYFPPLKDVDGRRATYDYWPDQRFTNMGMTEDVRRELFR